MDMIQNIALAVLGIACMCMAVKLRCQGIAIGGLREFFKEYAEENAEKHGELDGRIGAVADDVGKLVNGVVPDYEKAREAAKATNDFMSGIGNIMGYDPFAAMRKQEEGDKA